MGFINQQTSLGRHHPLPLDPATACGCGPMIWLMSAIPGPLAREPKNASLKAMGPPLLIISMKLWVDAFFD